MYAVPGATGTVWAHCASSCPAGVAASDDEPECACPVTALPPVHDHPLRPDSKPGLVIVLLSAAAGRTSTATDTAISRATAPAGAPTVTRRRSAMFRSFSDPEVGSMQPDAPTYVKVS